MGSKIIKGEEWDVINFATKEEYLNMREEEMKATGLEIDLEKTLCEMTSNVNKAVEKVKGNAMESTGDRPGGNP